MGTGHHGLVPQNPPRKTSDMYTPTKEHTMNLYQQLIADATGVTDPKRLFRIEQYMRHIYFHSTLSWQDEATLVKAAKESNEEIDL